MKTKVLILGGSSFAGSNFINFLIQKKKYNILGTYNSKKNLKKLIFKNSLDKFKLIKLDLSIENNKLLKIIKSFKPEYIFDFASVCLVNESWDTPNYYFKVNLNSKINFIKNMNNLSFIRKFIYVGTPEIFGSTLKPVKENSLIFNPSTPYAISKLSFSKKLISPFSLITSTSFTKSHVSIPNEPAFMVNAPPMDPGIPEKNAAGPIPFL